jgi:hypothetical protein
VQLNPAAGTNFKPFGELIDVKVLDVVIQVVDSVGRGWAGELTSCVRDFAAEGLRKREV